MRGKANPNFWIRVYVYVIADIAEAKERMSKYLLATTSLLECDTCCYSTYTIKSWLISTQCYIYLGITNYIIADLDYHQCRNSCFYGM